MDSGIEHALKVAISLPDDLLHRVDRARRERKVSRSESQQPTTEGSDAPPSSSVS
jgi:hypothetical protein